MHKTSLPLLSNHRTRYVPDHLQYQYNFNRTFSTRFILKLILPYSGGITLVTKPRDHAFLNKGHGNSPDLSYSAATGRISSLENLRARS